MGSAAQLERTAASPLAAVLIAVAIAISVEIPAAVAAPFLPTDDNQVLESGLPTTDPRVRQMRGLAQALREHPDDLAVAMPLASRQLAMGAAEADPRFVGYARGTLARWWTDDHAAPALRILRARILQAQHDFVPAAADLRAAFRDEPNAAQALLVLAGIDEVTGDLTEAKDACAKLAVLRPGLAASACAASIGSLTGESEKSYAALRDAVEREPTVDASQRVWALTILGEIAIRRGNTAAEQHLQQALAIGSRDVYALTVYADYLLDNGRAAEVLRLLRGFERVDALYLRLALAAQAIDDPGFPGYSDDVAARFAAARRQGDRLHLRDASRLALEIEHDAPRALDFARENWVVHKTPYDARALLAAAIACHDAAAAQPVIDWVAATRLEDKRLNRMIERLAAKG